VPAVVYGRGIEPIAVSVAATELRQALSGEAGVNALIELVVGDRRLTAMARELQRHPVRGTVLHVDFQVVDPDAPISSQVPVVLVGEARAVEQAGGVLDQQLFSVTVRTTPGRIPPHLELDVSGLEVGHQLRVRDLAVPEGVTVEADDDTPVVSALAPRVAHAAPASEAPTAATAEAPEPATGEALATQSAPEPSEAGPPGGEDGG
jgi:large subunit ribosomal protein L25